MPSKASKKLISSPDPTQSVRIGGIFLIIAVFIHGVFSVITTAMLKPTDEVYPPQVELSAELVESKTIVKVSADRGWQSTKIFIEKDNQVNIKVLDGEWTEWLEQRPYNTGDGSNYICSQTMNVENCVEPIPNFPSGALIGLIDQQVLKIGIDGKFIAKHSGILQLRINDADIGLHDNDGELIIEIVILK